MDRRKVAFAVGQYPKVSEVFILNAAASLLDSGCDLSILPVFDSPPEPSARHVVQDRIEGRAWIMDPDAGASRGARALRLPLVMRDIVARHGPSALRVLDPLLFGRSALRLWPASFAHALAGRADFDVIHCHFGTIAPFILALRRIGILKGAVAVHFRGYDISMHVKHAGADVYRNVFREADWFFANSEFFRNRAIELGCDPERIEVIPSGCDTTAFPYVERSLPKGRPIRLIAVGRLVEKKGYPLTLRAVAILRDRGYDVHLTIVGDGPCRGQIVEEVGALGLEGYVHLAGQQNHGAICRLLAEADIYVASSMTAQTGDQDGPVNTLKEAMATGMPVVASRHGGIPELVEDGVHGRLADEGDPVGLADGIADLVASPERWQEMGRRGRAKVVNGFSNDVANRKLLDAYERMIASRAGHTLGALPCRTGTLTA